MIGTIEITAMHRISRVRKHIKIRRFKIRVSQVATNYEDK